MHSDMLDFFRDIARVQIVDRTPLQLCWRESETAVKDLEGMEQCFLTGVVPMCECMRPRLDLCTCFGGRGGRRGKSSSMERRIYVENVKELSLRWNICACQTMNLLDRDVLARRFSLSSSISPTSATFSIRTPVPSGWAQW